MEKFTFMRGLVAPLDRDNVDTDAIMPKQFMKSLAKTGFGPNLFDSWRYLDTGEPGMDNLARPPNPSFVLNQPRYQGASILLTRRNFGCGSSREHAPWGLLQYGFRVIIAVSCAEIFMQNCYKNGILVVCLPEQQVGKLFYDVAVQPGFTLAVDLENQLVTDAAGTAYRFDIAPFTKRCLLNGLDEISLTLQHRTAIQAFEERHLAKHGWLADIRWTGPCPP